MQIQVKLVGVFRIGRFKEERYECREGSSVQDVIDSLRLPEQILGIVLVNGVHADFEDLLKEGDQVTIMPVLDGG